MSVITIEGVVDNGQIRLKDNLRLPENTKVYVVIPDVQIQGVAHIYSPHLVHREHAKDFALKVIEVIEEPPNDKL
ncbi:MAG: hypothetical protein WCD37_07855 [Chloroflexia bacterium]